MELVYLWVENHKNIHEQGFNFSPRFICHFKDRYIEEENLENNWKLVPCIHHEKGEDEFTIYRDRCRLSIIKNIDSNGNKKYINNFFGEDINVTAIAGKNGTGKSSILSALYDIFMLDFTSNYHESLLVGKYLLVFYNNIHKEFICLDNGMNDMMSNVANIRSFKGDDSEYLNFFKSINLNYFKAENPYLKHEKLYQKDARDNEKFNYDDSNMIIFNNEFIVKKVFQALDNNVEIPYFTPTKIWFSESFEHIIEYIRKLIYNSETLSYKSKVMFKKVLYDIELLNERNSVKSEIEEWERKLFLFSLLVIYDNKLTSKNFDTDKLLVKFSNDEWSQRDMSRLERTLSSYTTLKFSEYQTVASLSDINVSDITDFTLILKYIDFVEISIFDNNYRKFDSLSHGEKHLIGILLSLTIDSLKNVNPTFIILDEPDVSLHPQWQKEFFFRLTKLFPMRKNSLHLIITTHSPFLLSDIPRQNIIFLDKNKDGTCKVLNTLREKKQTFGANIHTLLSDSFFMEDGLMGEFAKNKIEEVVNFLQETKSEIKTYEETSKIIDIVGEPVLKMKLQRMLEDYKKKHTLESEEDIRKQIEELQKKLEEKQSNG